MSSALPVRVFSSGRFVGQRVQPLPLPPVPCSHCARFFSQRRHRRIVEPDVEWHKRHRCLAGSTFLRVESTNFLEPATLVAGLLDLGAVEDPDCTRPADPQRALSVPAPLAACAWYCDKLVSSGREVDVIGAMPSEPPDV